MQKTQPRFSVAAQPVFLILTQFQHGAAHAKKVLRASCASYAHVRAVTFPVRPAISSVLPSAFFALAPASMLGTERLLKALILLDKARALCSNFLLDI